MRIILALLAALWAGSASAQTLQDLLQAEPEAISDPSRRTVGEVLDKLVDSGLSEVPVFLERWQGKQVFQRQSDGLFFYAEEEGDGHILYDISTGEEVGRTGERELTALKPNAGVRAVIGSALIEFQLSDPDPLRRQAALAAIADDPAPDHLAPLRAAIPGEEDPTLLARKERLEALLSARFEEDPDTRAAAIGRLGSDISVEARSALNQILASEPKVAPAIPEGANVAQVLEPGSEALPRQAAYSMLVEAGLAPPRVTESEIRDALVAAIEGGKVGDVPLPTLNTDEARHAAYDAIAPARGLPPRVTEQEVAAALAAHAFWVDYAEPDRGITAAAERALASAETRVAAWQGADLLLDGVSLASIYFLAAIGLAITFGVMGVINMAHGEFIMMGAYTGYVVQTLVPDYTLSLLLALPLAFAITFGAGVLMERLVIRHLAHRPLETLLATFGISIALQQIAKNIFGTQARPLTSPAWLDGAWVINDVAGIAYIRIAIFVLALLFLGLILFILRRTRLGLEVRAVTQNPGMAASMGINPDRIGMLTFGLGSGIAGIAGVAIGLYAKVTSEMGADYIVQSFMTVVVGGVGNVWGTLAGAGLIGGFQKSVEWLNPSNTLAAQTFMILFIIAFIQFRPRGIVAMKGRAAGA
ncbi:MAG: Urea ABC transporter, permease protein UrtB [uncultured Rubellimicrobium sp.]|uniref:Urea ABC transporter, permease protein UrtB n=1 Tax=uncultured Rubellimicrobium sp. TaxID=543078 RepID=A0A6J4PWG8_9RHOB|nr:MAG: Urea ABC transporter, permease protein UrtB [uncultured Rubellimicrobium sp.]